MRYKPLEEPCKNCLGCNRLEDPDFTGDKNCQHAEKETVWEQEEIWKKL